MLWETETGKRVAEDKAVRVTHVGPGVGESRLLQEMQSVLEVTGHLEGQRCEPGRRKQLDLKESATI